jgi:hypothetical protein
MQGFTTSQAHGMRAVPINRHAFREGRPLGRSRMMICALKVGEKAPDFALKDQVLLPQAVI